MDDRLRHNYTLRTRMARDASDRDGAHPMLKATQVWQSMGADMRKIIQLSDSTDPRYVIVDELPERITWGDLLDWRYGKPLAVVPREPDVVYPQPDGPGTDWVRPDE